MRVLNNLKFRLANEFRLIFENRRDILSGKAIKIPEIIETSAKADNEYEVDLLIDSSL